MSTAAAPEMKRTIALLHVLRNAKLIDYVGLTLVGLVVLWIVVNFVKEPVNFINVAFIGLTNGSIYGVVALGYTLVYGILQLINFAHGDVFALSGLVASTVLFTLLNLSGDSSNAAIVGGIIVCLLDHDADVLAHQRGDRTRRVQAATTRAAARAADHRRGGVVHRPERLTRASTGSATRAAPS